MLRLAEVDVQSAQTADERRSSRERSASACRPAPGAGSPATASLRPGGSCGSRRRSARAQRTTRRRSAPATRPCGPATNGTVTSWPASFAAFSTAAQPPRTIRSASETFVPPDCEPLKSCWMPSRVCSTVASSAGLLTSQSFCGASRIRAPLAPPRLSVPRKLAADAHAVDDQLGDGQPGVEDLALEGGDVRLADQVVVDGRDRVLPELRLRNPRAEVARDGPHVAVQQLVPRLGEGVGELVGVLVEAPGDRARRSGRSSAPGPT